MMEVNGVEIKLENLNAADLNALKEAVESEVKERQASKIGCLVKELNSILIALDDMGVHVYCEDSDCENVCAVYSARLYGTDAVYFE